MTVKAKPDTSFDVAIVGAGPAGLSLATELGQRYSVALIEKKRILATKKAWGIAELDGFRADDDLVLNRLTKGTIRIWEPGQYHDFTSQMPDGTSIALLDEKKVKSKWAKVARENCTVYENTTYVNYEYVNRGIRINTTGGGIIAKLLVDASGYDSSIMKQLGLGNQTDYLVPTYGGYVRNTSFPDTRNGIGIVVYPTKEIFSEYFPITEQKGCVWIFRILTQQEFKIKSEKDWISDLRGTYKTLVSQDPEMKGSELYAERHGVIPMKKGQRKAADRILLVGDAGGSTPYSMLGFNVIYKNYRHVAEQISSKIDAVKLDRQSLEGITFNRGNRFSGIVAPLMIQSVTELSSEDVLAITRKLKERNLFDEFAEMQAYAMDDSLRFHHMMTFIKKLSRLTWKEKIDTFRDFNKFLSIREIGRIAYAALREIGKNRLFIPGNSENR